MQTAAISYRVADFLKRHAPFESMEEGDLLALSGRGRVKFHESDESVCWQGEKHGAHVFVIQQGSVSLWEKEGEAERLRDIRGPGDIVGLERFHGWETSQYSARTNSDVVLYALDAMEFERLIGKYPKAERYVASYASVNVEFAGEGHHRPAEGVLLIEAPGAVRAELCGESTTIREAASRLAQGAAAIGVAGKDGRAAGVITAERLVRWISEGGGNPESPVAILLDDELTVVAEDAGAVESMLAMAAGSGAVAITQDGTSEGRVRGVARASDLAPVFGEDPAGIVRGIRTAGDCDSLRHLHQRARTFLLGHLHSASAVDWLARYARLVDEAILDRVLDLAGAPREGVCWCFHGAAGRGESLTAVMPQIAVIAGTGAARSEAEAAHERVQGLLEQSGYVTRTRKGHEVSVCATLNEWEARFRGWITDPVHSGIWRARPLFDMRAVGGDQDLWKALDEHVQKHVRSERRFTTILAHDCLANVPPLTFFRDLVVAESGEQTNVFRLEGSALVPLVDLARVFGAAAGQVLGSSSRERFELACGLVPEQDALFKEASETLRVVLFHQARAGIRQHSEGYDIPAAQLSAQEKQVLKSGFRTILKLLEFTTEFAWQEAR